MESSANGSKVTSMDDSELLSIAATSTSESEGGREREPHIRLTSY